MEDDAAVIKQLPQPTNTTTEHQSAVIADSQPVLLQLTTVTAHTTDPQCIIT